MFAGAGTGALRGIWVFVDGCDGGARWRRMSESLKESRSISSGSELEAFEEESETSSTRGWDMMGGFVVLC